MRTDLEEKLKMEAAEMAARKIGAARAVAQQVADYLFRQGEVRGPPDDDSGL